MKNFKLFIYFLVLMVVLSSCNISSQERDENAFNSSSEVSISKTELFLSEDGTNDVLSVKLKSKPLSSVTLSFVSEDSSEVSVDKPTLTFDASNWSDTQSLTVVGIDDIIVDGDISSNIQYSVASADSGYDGKSGTISVTTNDNEVPSVVLSKISNNTKESGTTATFTVNLSEKPINQVTLTFESSDLTEGTISPKTLTFTELNYNGLQTITVTGMDDSQSDGDVSYEIQNKGITDASGLYASLTVESVSVSNIDDELPGFTISNAIGNTREDGTTATFTISMNTEPSSDVILNLSSSNESEGVLSTSSITFTSLNWDSTKTITITGKDDFRDDGNVSYNVVFSKISGSNTGYDGLTPSSVTFVNEDDDTAGISTYAGTVAIHNSNTGVLISQNPSFIVSENNTSTDPLKIRLNTEPLSNVVVSISSSDTTETSLSKSSITFTSANWNSLQSIDISGLLDSIADGDIANTIILSVSSTDGNYNGNTLANIPLITTDIDVPTIVQSNFVKDVILESGVGSETTFTVSLGTIPLGVVVLDITSSDTTEAIVNPSQVTLTDVNWNSLKTITVIGKADSIADGNQVINIIVTVNTGSTTDTSGYAALASKTQTITVEDSEASGTIVSSISNDVGEDGTTATFTVKLKVVPTSLVFIPISSGDTTEATVDKSSLTFTPNNWNSLQTVTITGIDDNSIDGDQTFNIILDNISSSDVDYNGLNPTDLTGTNIDNETAQFLVSAISGTTDETGTTATFTVSMNAAPSATISVDVTSSDTTEGTTDTDQLVFTTVNWNSEHSVTVTGVSDNIIDGDQSFTIILDNVSGTDTAYTSLDPADVSVVNTDANTAGFLVISSSTQTTESLGNSIITVKLKTSPTNDVTLSNIISSDTSEGSLSANSIIFAGGTTDWSDGKTLTVTGKNDSIDDGNIQYSIQFTNASSSDANYNGIKPTTVLLTNIDDDTAGFTVSTISQNISETGDNATFTIVLNSQPLDNVVIGISSSDLTEGSVDKSSLTFTVSNWNTPQTVTVQGLEDIVYGDTILFSITTTSDTTTSDTNYNGLAVADVSVTNREGFISQRGLITSPIALTGLDNGSIYVLDKNKNDTVLLSQYNAITGGFTPILYDVDMPASINKPDKFFALVSDGSDTLYFGNNNDGVLIAYTFSTGVVTELLTGYVGVNNGITGLAYDKTTSRLYFSYDDTLISYITVTGITMSGGVVPVFNSGNKIQHLLIKDSMLVYTDKNDMVRLVDKNGLVSQVSSVLGTNIVGFATALAWNKPIGLDVKGNNIYVADSKANFICEIKINIDNNTCYAFAGTGVAGTNSGTVSGATMNKVSDMFQQGNSLWIIDNKGNMLREIY